MAGMCTATVLEVGKVYIVPVTDDLTATGVSITGVAKIQEALKACNLNPPTYPIGLTADYTLLKAKLL